MYDRSLLLVIAFLLVAIGSPASAAESADPQPGAVVSEEAPSTDSRASEAAAERGAALLVPLKRDLMKALKAGLAEGPTEAIGACREQAPGIAAALSKDGVRVGRASHRLRNPSNAAPDWVAPILAAYLADPTDRVARTVRIDDERMGHAEAIVMKPLCGTCHGAALAPELAAQLEALYPEDEAVGFADGELRGVFWVEFPERASAID